MNCYRHRARVAVGVCAACGKGLCGEGHEGLDGCARDGALGLHCDEACAGRLRQRRQADAATPVGWGWSMLLIVLGVALLYFGYRYSEFAMSVPNLLGMLFVWYGAVLLLQRVAQRRVGPAPKS